jgi:hypothetical protein
MRLLAGAAGLALLLAVGYGADRIFQADDVVPLARADGWRPELGAPFPGPSAVLEIAYDRETAAQAWSENVPAGGVGLQRARVVPAALTKCLLRVR